MKPKNKTLQHLGFIALAFAGFATTSAQAASQTWTNSASDLLWNTTSTNWTGVAWTNNNDAVFGATGVGSIAVASDVIVNDITFSTTGYTLTGNLMLANDQASTFTATQSATISAIIANNTAGASSLTKAGANTLTLSGANTYSGGTTLNAGIVSVGNDAAFGTGAVTIAGASTVTNSTNVTLANNFTTTALPTFTSSGGTMVLNGNITGGQGVTLNATNKITLAGTNNVATTSSGTNTFFALLVNAGAGGVDITGSTTVGPGAGGTSFNGGFAMLGTSTVTLQSGGSLTVNGSGTSTTNIPNSIVGQNTVGTSTVLVDSGSLTIGASTGFVLGNGNNNNIAANGVLTISSGTATINRGTVPTTTNGTDTRLIMMGRDSNSATGTINLNGGTLATDRQFVRDGSSTGQAGTANFVFGGGTLKALGTQTDWLQSTTATSAGQNQGTTGGTVNNNAQALSSVTTTSALSTIDANGFSVAINNAISGAGGFNINSSTGTGTVTFGGANTYSGPTTISAGRLNVTGAIDNTSAVALGAATLGGNGTLGAVTVNNAGAVISNGNANTDTLNLGSLNFTTGATLNLNKANDTFTPALAITGNLATTAGITINIPVGPVWANGDYDLISFGSGPAAGATPNLTVGSIAGLGGRQSGTLSSTGSSIILTIGGDNPVWTGVGSQTWTTAATNNNTGPNAWALKNGHTPTNFWANDSVEFNDTYNLNPFGDVAVSNSTVTIQGGVAPANVTFNNSSVDYVIASDDSTGITTGTLSKNGVGIVTLNTTNTYTGATVITNGTLRLGDGTTNGDIASSSSIVNDGDLILNRSTGSFSYSNVISGFGSVVKNGAGTQILSGSNTYFGGTTINAGTVQVGSGGTTGTPGSGAITNDAALVFNRTNAVVQGTDFGFIEGTGSVTQSGTGAVTFSFDNTYSGGTAINSGTLVVGATNTLGTGPITLAGGTLSGTAAADTTLANALVAQASTTSVLSTNGKNLSLNGNLTGSGNINRTATGNPATVWLGGDNSGYSGTFTVDTNGSAATRFTAATAGSQDAKWVINQSVTGRASLESSGGTIKFGSLTGTGFLTNGSTNTIEVGNLGLSETFSGVLNQGTATPLAVTKVGAGTWTLTGTNTYTGDTTVDAGVLAVDGDAIANANKLVINGGKVDPMGATEVVGTLYFGTTQQAAGTWGATGSGAAHIDDTHFSGTGVVSVTTGPVAGYTAWADANGATGQTKDQDHDNDGVDNGIEYFMGQTGSTFTANPAPVSGTVTWPMGADYAGVYGNDYEIQTSSDLVTWVPVDSGSVTVTQGESVSFTLPTGDKLFVRLVVKN